MIVGRKMKKVKLIAIVLAMICAGTIPVLAYIYFFETEPTYITSGIVLQSYPTPNMTLGFYWDINCTQPVTNFSFGEMIHPQTTITLWTAPIYIRNEGDVWHEIHWNSTLSTVSSEISQWWTYDYHNFGGYAINGYKIQPGQILETWYGISIPAYATVGTYNWTLTAWGEHYY